MKAFAMLLLMLLTETSLAKEGEFQVGVRIGVSRQDVDKEVTTTKERDEGYVGLGLGGTVAYVTPIGVLLEGGYGLNVNPQSDHADQETQEYENTFDEYRFSAQTVVIGYQFESKGGWRFTPKLGRMRWKLKADEGEFLHSGPESEHTYEGYGDFWELAVTKKVNDWLAWGIIFQDNGFEHGRVRSLLFNATFSW